MAEKRIPMRTCISCRKEFHKNQLLRIVKNKNGQFTIDKTGKMDGRGAYICGEESCLAKLKKAKMLNRSFKMEVPHEIYEQIEEDIIGTKK